MQLHQGALRAREGLGATGGTTPAAECQGLRRRPAEPRGGRIVLRHLLRAVPAPVSTAAPLQ